VITDVLQGHLETMLGAGATFHPDQREAIEATLGDGARVLVVQRTGWGKSLVYWIAARVRRDLGAGPTLIVSPLLALMRNQIQMAERLGVKAVTINSSNTTEWAAIEASLEANDVDVLLISPERLANEAFIDRILPALGAIGMLVVDEAHCISDWGHDFRPDYRRLARILGALPASVPVLATTATANDRVVQDVAAQLGQGVEILRGPLARESLSLHVIALADQAERLAWLAEHVPELPGSGIIYCLTVADTFRVAGWLSKRGINVVPYNASVAPELRLAAEDALLRNQIKALVATTALGMGFDKPDLGFVVHYQRPGSAVAYYQQVGRAGRGVEHAEAILLTGREDDDIAKYFIDSAFPPAEDQAAVVEVLAARTETTLPQLEASLNLRRGQMEKALKLLEIDGAVGREGGRYFRTTNPWQPDVERMDRVTATRLRELAQMQEYVIHQGCLMEFLGRALDDPLAAPCGQCGNDAGAAFSNEVQPALVQAATTFLRRDARPMEPRQLWPPGAVSGLRGRIEWLNMPGMALSIYGDAGWGRLVREGKYTHGAFDPRLVAAARDLINNRWQPNPAPTWVTAIPSARRPTLVRDFAASLADSLGLPFKEVLAPAPGAEQKGMENSAQRLRNVRSKISLVGTVPAEPVLLVDDIADSGWTLAYAGWLLGGAGVSAVFPFALALASNRGDA
jgi:ATP-dependent DNA helicase RecQ